MNRTTIHWLEGETLRENCTLIEAVPGVGNVGKIVIDGLVEKHPSRTLGWIIHPDFPPHARLDEEGLIRPPRLELKSIIIPNGETLVGITGLMQPMTAAGQFEVSETILGLALDSAAPRLLVLAGLASGPEERSIHVICANAKYRTELESGDISVSRDQPNSGMIGIAGMVLSLSAIKGVNAAGIIADTVGTSCDVLAADRMAKWIEQAFDIPLELDLDTTKDTASRLMSEIEPSGGIGDLLNDEEAEVSADFYV